jgi:predicted kinase
MEAVIFIGIQAVGKSTFYCRRFADTHVRINLDMLKTRHRERILIEACLAAKQPFVVDNTNVTVADRARYIASARAAGFRVVGYYFQSGLQDAMKRNRQRAGAKVIPERGIAATQKRLQVPSVEEGFDALYSVTISRHNGFIVRPWPGEITRQSDVRRDD